LCRQPGTIGHPPYVLRQSGGTQFTFTAADFEDGPYFDQPAELINGFVNTMTLSGSSGTVTVTVASTVGVNDGTGFKSTDVGRLIWFQGGPPSYQSGTSYPKNYKVLGSDNNIYISLVAANLGNDPTTDDGSRWEISSESVQITWLKITAFTSTTQVTALVKGATLTTGLASIHWRLGVYSNTTSYPSCGGFHEGRLYLGGAIENRFDGSRNFKPLLFSPTEVDGTVSDDNAINQTLNNKRAENISWMLSTEEGLTVGSLSGEWIIKASALDDPITPTTVQARNVTTYGCANTEPEYAYGATVFIQSNTRKLMSHTRNYKGQYEAINHSEKAEGLMAPGLAEVQWVQEPWLSLFCRRTDGALLGATHRVSLTQEPFTGWHRHTHALSRTFESISAGPNFTGTSDSLYAVTLDSTATGPYWIETTMPVTSGGDPVWHAWHTDASSPAWFIRRMLVASGDSFDGIIIYGLNHLEGITVHPFVGGLDLGNFVVTNGSISCPYSGTFTAAFLASFGTIDRGDWGLKLRWADSPVTTGPTFPLNTIAVVEQDGGAVAQTSDRLLFNEDMTKAWMMNEAAPSLRAFDGVTGTRLAESNDLNYIFNGAPGAKSILSQTALENVWMYVPADQLTDGTPYENSKLFGLVDYTTFLASRYSEFDTTTLKEVRYYPTRLVNVCTATTANIRLSKNMFTVTWRQTLGQPNTDNFRGPHILSAETGGDITLISSAALGAQHGTNQIAVMFGQLDSNSANVMSMMNLTNNGPLMVPICAPLPEVGQDYTLSAMPAGYEMLGNTTLTGNGEQFGCRGREVENSTVFYTWGHNGSWALGYPNCTHVTLRQWFIGGPYVTGGSVGTGQLTPFTVGNRFTRTLPVTTIDPTWAQMKTFTAVWSPYDDTLILFASQYPSGTSRVLKYDIVNDRVIWNVLTPQPLESYNFPSYNQPPLSIGRWGFISSPGTGSIGYELDLVTGVWTVIGTATGFTVPGRETWFDDVGPSAVHYARFAAGAFTMVYNGPYAIANQPTWAVNRYNRIWFGTSYTQTQDHRELNATYYFVPESVGVSFTSRGQVLRPDFGVDAGARNGPAFGKVRRVHEYAISVDRTFDLNIGTDFDTLYAVKFATDGGTRYAAPELFTGIVADTLKNNYTYDGKIAWQSTRQYPVTVTAVGGYVMTQDR
jgi:hypothetical protein